MRGNLNQLVCGTSIQISSNLNKKKVISTPISHFLLQIASLNWEIVFEMLQLILHIKVLHSVEMINLSTLNCCSGENVSWDGSPEDIVQRS